MFVREIKAEYRGHLIVVTNSWGIGAVSAFIQQGVGAARRAFGDQTKLFIDGEVVRSSSDWIMSANAALLRFCMVENDDKYHVEVYAKPGLFKNLIKICINEQWIAGDKF